MKNEPLTKKSIFLNHIDKLIEGKFANVDLTFCFPLELVLLSEEANIATWAIQKGHVLML